MGVYNRPIDPDQFVGMTRQVLRFISRLDYRMLTGEEDISLLGRMRYHSYLKAGLIDPNASETLVDDRDRDPTFIQLGVLNDRGLIGAIRLKLLTKESPFCMAHDLYPEIIEDEIAKGSRLVEGSRFVAAVDEVGRDVGLPLAIMRAAGMFAHHVGADYIINTPIISDVSFYQRVLFSDVWCHEAKPFQALKANTVLLRSCTRKLGEALVSKRPYFWSTEAERQALFGKRSFFHTCESQTA